ncbi:MAG: hypothetical protein MHM6MM_001958 [Cercozoa sp. M6MM]
MSEPVDPLHALPRNMGDRRRARVLYPAYFDKNRSIKQGRRVSKELAVKHPTAHDIAEAAAQLGLPVLLERKQHPKDHWSVGRARVMLLDEQMRPAKPDIATKEELLQRVAKLLPNVTGREERQAQLAEVRAQEEEAMNSLTQELANMNAPSKKESKKSASKASATAVSNKAPGAKKKGGKKKKGKRRK